MVNKVQVSIPAFIVCISVLIVVALFWLFYKNVTHASSMLDKKLSLEHTVTCLSAVVAHVLKSCGKGGVDGVITPASHPLLSIVLDGVEQLRVLNDPTAYVFILDAKGNQVVNGGNSSIAHVNGSRPGVNTLEYTDNDGNKAIQMLLSKAATGGGYVEYKWPHPTTQQYVKKLSYVTPIAGSTWILGSGLYL